MEVTETTTTTGASIAVTETTQRSSTGTRVSTTTAGPTTTTYTPRPKNPPALSETQKAKIKEDWISNSELQLTADEVKIRYYGTYNGYMALLIIYDYDGEAPDCPEQYNIEEYTFTRGLGEYFCLYRNSTFIDLQRAYESGLITEQDVRDIHYYATGGRGISSTMPD